MTATLPAHSLTLSKDDGWDRAECSCGWSCEAVPGAEIAAEMWADHLLSQQPTGQATQGPAGGEAQPSPGQTGS